MPPIGSLQNPLVVDGTPQNPGDGTRENPVNLCCSGADGEDSVSSTQEQVPRQQGPPSRHGENPSDDDDDVEPLRGPKNPPRGPKKPRNNTRAPAPSKPIYRAPTIFEVFCLIQQMVWRCPLYVYGRVIDEGTDMSTVLATLYESFTEFYNRNPATVPRSEWHNFTPGVCITDRPHVWLITTHEGDTCVVVECQRCPAYYPFSYNRVRALAAARTDAECPICLRDIALLHAMRLSNPRCNHTFCFDCIQAWARIKKSCPLCRATFTKIVAANNDVQSGAPPS